MRWTPKRREVYKVLMEYRDHPTAGDVFARLREKSPSISLATVYNCLEALVEHGHVKQINFDREPSRFCPNLQEHCHFQDQRSGEIHDVAFKPGTTLADVLELPPGATVCDVEINLRGLIAQSENAG